MPNEKYDAFSRLSTADKVQTIGNGAIDYTAIKAAALKSAGKRAAAAKFAPAATASKVILPITMAIEAAQNTKQGWGNAADEQLQRVGDDHGYGMVDGAANPLATLYSAGRAAVTAAEQPIRAGILDPALKAQQEQQANLRRFTAVRRMPATPNQPIQYSVLPLQRQPAPIDPYASTSPSQ